MVVRVFHADFNFSSLGDLDLPDDLMQGYDAGQQQSSSADLQTPPVPQPGHDNASLQALLARSTPNSQHGLASSIASMASAAGHQPAAVGAMAAAGLDVNAVKNALPNSMPTPSHAATMNKAATATSSHMVGAGDGLPGMNFSMATSVGGNPMMNSMNMKPMGPNPMMGGVPGMPGMGMPQPQHDPMMNGPGFPPNMGQMRGMAPTTMGNGPPLSMRQNNMMGSPPMPPMPGQPTVGHVMNVPQNQGQIPKVSNPCTTLTFFFHYYGSVLLDFVCCVVFSIFKSDTKVCLIQEHIQPGL